MKQGLACQRAPKPEGELPPNDKIVKKLEELCEFYESSDDATNQFKLRGTRRAINKLKLLGRDLTDDDVEESALRRILGSKFKVGSNKETIKKIQEIHESGDLDRLRTYRADPRRCAIMELSKVWGIGYRKAQTLIDKNNIWSVKELKEEAEKNPKIVEARVHRTLRCHDDLQLRMSREEALLIGDRVRSCAKAVFAELLPLHDVAKLKVEGAPAASRFADRASISRRWRRRDAATPSTACRRHRAQVPWAPSGGPARLRRRRCVGDARGLAGRSRAANLVAREAVAESSLSRSSYAQDAEFGDEEATEGEDPDYGAQRSRASRDKFLATLRDRLHARASSRTIWAVTASRRRRRRSRGSARRRLQSYMGICKPRETHRRLDIKVYAPQHYAYAMIYFTGNDYSTEREVLREGVRLLVM